MSRWRLERRTRLVWGADSQGIAWHAGADEIEVAGHVESIAAALAAARRARRIDVIASNELAVHWLQQPPAATRSLDELKLVTAARCAYLHGGAPGDWWIAGDWTTRRAFVCSALPRSVAEPLQRACRAQGSQLHWHSAWSLMCAARARQFPDEGWSAMRSPRRVVLWRCTSGHVDAIGSMATTPDAAATEVQAAVDLRIKLEGVSETGSSDTRVHWAEESPTGQREAIAALVLGDLLEQSA